MRAAGQPTAGKVSLSAAPNAAAPTPFGNTPAAATPAATPGMQRHALTQHSLHHIDAGVHGRLQKGCSSLCLHMDMSAAQRLIMMDDLIAIPIVPI